jgi:hypothetical protein
MKVRQELQFPANPAASAQSVPGFFSTGGTLFSTLQHIRMP